MDNESSPDKTRRARVRTRAGSKSFGSLVAATGAALLVGILVAALIYTFLSGDNSFQSGDWPQTGTEFLVTAAALVPVAAFALWLIFRARRQRRMYEHFGESTLELHEDAVAPGGHLRASLLTGIREPLMPPEGFRVRLAFGYFSGSEGGSSFSILWRDEQHVAGELSARSEPTVVVPIDFDLPLELPQLGDSRDKYTRWRVEVKAETPAGPFGVYLRVPVAEIATARAGPPSDPDCIAVELINENRAVTGVLRCDVEHRPHDREFLT